MINEKIYKILILGFIAVIFGSVIFVVNRKTDQALQNRGTISIKDFGKTPFQSAYKNLPRIWVSDGGRYFVTENGEPFIPIGNQGGTGFLLEFSDENMEAHFARMKESGENVIRVDFDHFYPNREDKAKSKYIGLESKVGFIDMAVADKIDRMFDLATKYGIYVNVVPFITSPPMWESWPLNPYSVAQGGPAKDPADFMQSVKARQFYGARLEAISGRWGGLGAFFLWDLMNESDVLVLNKEKDSLVLKSWLEEVGGRIAKFEEKKYGKARPRLMSWVDAVPKVAGYDFIFDTPVLNVAGTHPYDIYGTSPANVLKSRNLGSMGALSVVEPALKMNEKIREILSKKITDRRPYMENERHQNNGTMLTFYREADRRIAWAELSSGSAGAGIIWLVPTPVEKFEERHKNLAADRKALRSFINLIPREFFLSDTKDESIDAIKGDIEQIKIMSVRRGPYAVGWMVDKDDKCILAQSVNEVRRKIERGERPEMQETLFAVALWQKLLKEAGITILDKDDLQSAIQELGEKIGTQRDLKSIDKVVTDQALLFMQKLEVDEKNNKSLLWLSQCASRVANVEFKMPQGEYTVYWVNDRNGDIVQKNDFNSVTQTITTPSFEQSLAFIIAPKQK